MRIAYGDLIGGISGDMFVAALLELGLPRRVLEFQLRKLAGLEFSLKATRKMVHSVRATRFHVICRKPEAPRSWRDIRRMIERGKLPPEVRETGLEIFRRLAEAEGKIHNVAPEKVHFHEVGATDSIVDIMAAAIGCHELKIGAFRFSKVPLGRALAHSGHGPLPVPGPATLELLKGVTVEWTSIQGETVTPTGAALIATLGREYDKQVAMRVDKVGYGAGQKEWPDRPNLFRLVLGSAEPDWQEEEMLVIETNIDDMNPQYYDHVMDRLFGAGARDVFMAPIQMKKNRPAVLLRVIAEAADKARLAQILFEETTTIGLRYYSVGRVTLRRTSRIVKTRFGSVRVKALQQPDGSQRIIPEYDELKRIATARKLPLSLVREAILKNL